MSNNAAIIRAAKCNYHQMLLTLLAENRHTSDAVAVALESACKSDNFTCVKTLYPYQVYTNQQLLNAMCAAYQFDNIMIFFIMQLGDKIHHNDFRDTAIHSICVNKQLCLLGWLIAAGLDVNTVLRDGTTPLTHAVQHYAGRGHIFSLLVAAGADLFAKDYNDKTAQELAKEHGFDNLEIILGDLAACVVRPDINKPIRNTTRFCTFLDPNCFVGWSVVTHAPPAPLLDTDLDADSGSLPLDAPTMSPPSDTITSTFFLPSEDVPQRTPTPPSTPALLSNPSYDYAKAGVLYASLPTSSASFSINRPHEFINTLPAIREDLVAKRRAIHNQVIWTYRLETCLTGTYLSYISKDLIDWYILPMLGATPPRPKSA